MRTLDLLNSSSDGRSWARSVLLSLAMGGILVAYALVPGDGLAVVQEEKPQPYKPVVELDIIMYKVDDYYLTFEELVEKKKLRSLNKDAAFVAEMMNLATVFNKEKGWKDIAVECRDLCLEISKAAKEKKGDAIPALIAKLDTACENCHEKYRD